MIKNYFLIAVRNLFKNAGFSLINIIGLAIGLACFILIGAYVYNELHYDRFAKDGDRIYRVNVSVIGNGAEEIYPNVDVAVGPGIRAAYPEVESSVRFLPQGETFLSREDHQYKEKKIAFADSNFLNFFSLPLIAGNPSTALTAPNSLVLTESMARKYFPQYASRGAENILDQSINMGRQAMKVTGILADMPFNAHFHFDAIGSMATFHLTQNTWSNIGFYTYLKLRPDANPQKLQADFPRLVEKYVVPEVQHDMGVSLAEAQKSVNTFRFQLMPLHDIHLRGNTKYELEPNGDIRYVYIFSALAIFVLLLACVNFMNLSTARSAGRSKEIGIRKVLGSVRGQLISQFLFESILITYCALILALGLAVVTLPLFNQISGRQFDYHLLLNGSSVAFLLLLGLVVGCLAGIYPAFYLSSFNPVRVLKGILFREASNRHALRSGLVVFQFFVSTSLIIATLVAYRQLHYMQDRKLGYDKDQVIYVEDTYLLGGRDTRDVLRESLRHDSRVTAASTGTAYPGNPAMDGTQIYPKEKESKENDVEIHTNIFHVDYDYLATLGIPLVRGRNFSKDFPTDSFATVINESMVRNMGWTNTDPIGKIIVTSGRHEYRVIGVVKDFHYASVKEKIAPLMLRLDRPGAGLLIKVNMDHASDFVADLQKTWKSLNPQAPFSYFFLNEKFASLYVNEQKTATLFSIFCGIALTIACLGLLGLAAYTVSQRTREIGIRKVLGASVQQVLYILSKEFVILVGIACFIAIPFTWWLMNLWLREFAYRTHISVWIFLAATGFSLLIAVLTISFRALQSATANPVKSLKEM